MDRRKHFICAVVGICMAAAVIGIWAGERMELLHEKTARVQEGLAEEVFRFHVPANSDSEEDQDVKLKVRNAVLGYMKRNMDGKGKAASSEETREWAKGHLSELRSVAEEVLQENGFTYGAKAEVVTCYFPEKRYGDIVFPEGDYEALRIRLGEGRGNNWWCVLYPNLCFIDTACAVVSEEGKEDLKEALSAEEYEMVTAASDFKIKWFFFGKDAEEKQETLRRIE